MKKIIQLVKEIYTSCKEFANEIIDRMCFGTNKRTQKTGNVFKYILSYSMSGIIVLFAIIIAIINPSQEYQLQEVNWGY